MAHNFVEGFQAWSGTLPGTANKSPLDRQEGHMIDIISQDVYLVLLWIFLQTVKSFWHITFSFSKILYKSCCWLPLYCFDKFRRSLWSILKIGKAPPSLSHSRSLCNTSTATWLFAIVTKPVLLCALGIHSLYNK